MSCTATVQLTVTKQINIVYWLIKPDQNMSLVDRYLFIKYNETINVWVEANYGLIGEIGQTSRNFCVINS